MSPDVLSVCFCGNNVKVVNFTGKADTQVAPCKLFILCQATQGWLMR